MLKYAYFNSVEIGEALLKETSLSMEKVGFIDLAVCYIAVVSWHPGRAQAAKGGGVNSSKPYVSWVENGASQF